MRPECALNGWCYWTLRKAGASVEAATASLEGQPVSFKNELLFQHGTNFNEVPAWQRCGTGLYWAQFEKIGFNPQLNEAVTVIRRAVKIDEELPMGEPYGRFLLDLIFGPNPLP